MTSPKGFPSDQKNLTGTNKQNNFTTVVPKDPFRHGLDSGSDFVFLVGGVHTAEAGTGLENNPHDQSEVRNFIIETATQARKGDIVRFIDGALAGIEIPIVYSEANRFQIPIKDVAAVGNTFQILRRKSPQVDDQGVVQVATSGSNRVIQFDLDGVGTDVHEDTAVPANSNPLPVKYLNNLGVRTDLATEATLAAMSLKVDKLGAGIFTKAFDQVTVVIKNGNGDPTLIETRLATVLQQTATITYDIDGDFQNIVVT